MNQTLMTLAKHLRSIHSDWSWNECRSAIHGRRVTVDGVTIIEDTFRVNSNAVVIVHTKPQPLPDTPPKSSPSLTVYYSDEHIIVVEKESGLESVPFETKKQFEGRNRAKTPDTLIDIARKWLEQKEKQKLPPLKVVHRLDKGTSGIIVFARTVTAERELGQLFRRHDIMRSYIAFCHGLPSTGTIRSRLVENRGDGRRGSTQNKTLGKEAITHVERLETQKTPSGTVISRISCKLETGRTHQIRIHLSEAGHPLCGEKVYTGPRGGQGANTPQSDIPRIGLHAQELGFAHPVTGQPMHWTSPLPLDLSQWWEKSKN